MDDAIIEGFRGVRGYLAEMRTAYALLATKVKADLSRGVVYQPSYPADIYALVSEDTAKAIKAMDFLLSETEPGTTKYYTVNKNVGD